MTVKEIENELRQNSQLRELMGAALELKPETRKKFVAVVCAYAAADAGTQTLVDAFMALDRGKQDRVYPVLRDWNGGSKEELLKRLVAVV